MTYEVWSTENNRVFTASSREAVERFAEDCAKVSERYLEFIVVKDDEDYGVKLWEFLPLDHPLVEVIR